ncbi:MAG: hypothetical protein IJA07_10440 [Agathobacter sp.]|nr:hypothetical protein [Agathobacter sp.]
MLEIINEQFTPMDKKIITSDWENELKSLKKHKTLYLYNRIGPLIVGVYLKIGRLNTYYVPIYYVHNLCREFPAVTMTLQIEERMISIENHNNMYISAVETLSNKAFIPMDGDLTIDNIIAGYKKYFLAPDVTTFNEYEDLALVCGWTKDVNKTEYALDLVYKNLKSWPEERYFYQYNGFENWFSFLEQRVWQGDELRHIAQVELQKHKLEKVPERKIIY